MKLNSVKTVYDLMTYCKMNKFFQRDIRDMKLGLSLKNSSDKYILDQVRGASNVAVSNKAKKTAKAILNSVSALCV
jgi:hypothetical protein